MRNQNTSVIIAILVGVVFSIALIFGSLPKQDAVEDQPIPQGADVVHTSTSLAPKPTPAVTDEVMPVHPDANTSLQEEFTVQVSCEDVIPLDEVQISNLDFDQEEPEQGIPSSDKAEY